MSNLKNETIADIVAEMRSDCPEMHWDGTMYRDDDWVYTKETVEKLTGRIEAAHKREVAELRKCLNEAIREKCPFTRMSCKKGEPCDYECGTDKWRKALKGASND